ncbi:threonine/serine exporter family protein [Ferrimonas marina]|uniref:Uncharacterized membrane protein YjjP, DUF1212 family n=1 Tax=Ferrimonas marina TaxID=299255 RepID=A0A1M5MRP3_9GAMM|nr:threonine/serine exporter family protein [Ferrimonas marina]SHG79978.1 Uncharacterized membrane protein YjjP, DUF1212 family [Ferrimonas marina]
MSETEPNLDQRTITRLCVQVGQMLMQHNAESTLVVGLTRRLGLALGVESVEVALAASAMVVTTLHQGHCITSARECPDRGINMSVVTELQHLVVMAERQQLDINAVKQRLEGIAPTRYNRWLVLVMVALSCAAFSQLAGGDAMVFALTFVASSCGMWVRQELGHRHFNPLVNFGATAFVTTTVATPAVLYNLGNEPFLVMASSVLMLVPGFPLINAASDMVKGHINMGLARWTMASLLILSTCLGIVAAMNLFQVWPWLI